MANDLDQSISNAIASGVSTPIDAIAWLLRKAGIPGQEKPILGSDWMAEKGLTRPVEQSPAQIAGETVGNLMDPLGAVGALGKGAAALKATLLPILLRSDRTDAAVKAVKAGIPAQDLWDQYKLFRYPGQLTENIERAGKQARFGEEIPSGHAALKEGLLPNVLDNDELYRRIPGLAETEVKLQPYDPKSTAQGNYAHHVGLGGTIFINPQRSLDPENTFRHELNHAINAHTGQVGTLGSTTRLDITKPGVQHQIQRMADILGHAAPEQYYLVNLLRRAALTKPNRLWSTSAGERLAEADAYRAVDPTAPDISPTFHMNSGINQLVPPERALPDNLMRQLEYGLTLHEDYSLKALDYLLRNLK